MPPPPAGPNAGAPIPRCPRCGTLLAMESRFCGQCGLVLEPSVAPAPQPPPPAPAIARPSMKTMIGGPQGGMAAFVPPSPAAPSAPSFVPPPAAPVAPAAAPPVVASPSAGPVAVVAAHRTMLGVVLAPPGAASAPAVASAPSSEPASVRSAHRTMMGAIAPPTQGPAPLAAPPSQGSAPGMVQVANANKTMLGMNMNEQRARAEAPPMIGGIAPGVPPGTYPPGGTAPSPWAPQGTPGGPMDSIAGLRLAPRRRSPVLPIVLGLLAACAVGLGAFALYEHQHARTALGPPLDAQVVSDPDGTLAMRITLPGLPAGTVVRNGSHSAALDAHGQARLPLASAGTVGAIDVPLEVTPPGASSFIRNAHVVVAYRIDPDLSQLASDHPSLRLVFHVQPGAALQVNGQPVQTDAVTGLGAATIENVAPLPIDGRDALESSFDVRVRDRDGTTAQSVYQLRVPRTPLRIDRPAATTVTTASRLVVRGLAPGARRVSLNGTAVDLDAAGGFQTVAPIAATGHATWNLIAYSPQGAPAVARLDITRAAVGDRAAATAFLAGSMAGANELAHTALAPGTRARLRGRVLGSPRDYEGGTTFQLVVDAPACGAAHCLAWVDLDPGLAVNEGDTVEVVGLVTGGRAAMTAGGRRTDPVIHAAFVL